MTVSVSFIIQAGNKTITVNYGTGSYGSGADITGYYVVLNASTTANATQAYISDTDVATTGGAGQAAQFAFDASDTATAANWTAVNAPEPTSGLLLLLGMAGLALKRKRA